MNADEFKRRTDQVLQRASLAQKCEEVKKIIEESSTKELHGFFPELLGNIFGYDCNSDWGLKSSQRSIPFNQLKAFLSPSGPMFTLINKLQVDGYLKYEFFIKCLPLPTQNSLKDGNIPLLYHNKIQMSNVASTSSPRVVLLNAFEYYMFHFAYYIIYQQNTNRASQDVNWQNESTFVYLSILEDYLNYFLPTLPQANSGSTVPGPSNTQNTPWFGTINRVPPNQTQFTGLIRASASGHSPLAMQGHSVYDHSTGDIWRSETFIQILIEFWLNQNTMDSVTRNVLSHGQVYFMPSVDVVRAVRMLIKQIHTFVYSSGLEALSHQAISPLDELKRNIIPQMLQKKFYCFLRHGFAHWPLDPSFRVIVETWLSFIQPWRYANSPTVAKTDASTVFSPEWCPFIHDNFPFFSVIVQEFVLRALKLDLYSSKDAYILLRVTKVLAQEDLMDVIERGEQLLSESPKNGLRGSGSSISVNVGSSIRANYMDLEGHAYNYVLEEKLQRLVCNISTAIASIKHPKGNQNSQTQASMGWFKTLLSGEFLDSDYNENRDTDKVISYLEQSYQFLTAIAKNCDVIDAGEQTVPWATPSAARERLNPSITSSSTISHGSIPECIQTDHGLIVTDRGRYQMINGLRRFEVQYTGDPELQPIRSYENPTLVRFLYHFSTYLNSKIGDRLHNMYSSPGYLSSIAYRLSPCLHNTTHDPLRNAVPSTPSHNASITSASTQSSSVPIPRISLRFLASYKTMFYFLMFYLLCKLFSLGLLTILALFILVLFFSILTNVCPVYDTGDEVQKKLF